MPSTSGKVRFGVFETDLVSGELRKHGIRIKLHDQPFKVLALLLEHPGELITREDLCQRLWPADTFVDSEVGLNSAVMKLREALGDSAENSRFIETLPRRGYRFIPEVMPVNTRREMETQSLPPVTSVERASYLSKLRLRTALLRGTIVFAALAILGVAAWLVTRPKPHPYSIAVLPLRNLSAEPGSDYFSDGLTDEIIRNLSIIDGLEVKSRTSSFSFKGQPPDIHEVGARLDASLILEGSVFRAGDKLRVNVQLIRVSDDHPLWSGRYDRKLEDIFAIQDDISRSIVNELRLKVGRGQRRYNTNLEAYDDYLRAGTLLNKMPGYESESIAASIPLFEKSIAKDPNFAPAYAGIADAYAYMSASARTYSPAVAYTKMRSACEKALHLDPLLAEAHACMGLINTRDHAWTEAEKSFRRALDLNPNLSAPRQDFALWVLTPLGSFEEAVRELRIALKLDPLSTKAQNLLDFVLILAGRNEEALANCQKVLTADPDNQFAQQLSGRVLVQQGHLDEGIAILQKLGEGSEGFLGYAYAKAGRRAQAEQIASHAQDWPWIQALVYAGLGDKDRAIVGLQKMVAIKDPRAGNYLWFPEFALLRGDPRLNDIRKTLGLPEVGSR